MKHQPILKTKRLILKPFTIEDSSRVTVLAGDKKIADVTANIPHPYPEGLANEWISTHSQKW
ncbi:MAG: GNAT family N-acetyltransferase, partial [Gammaproteobacteria bacterium]|nr:GNAT family N-acetyltransferase [Gammaproteobacteria bacterium]